MNTDQVDRLRPFALAADVGDVWRNTPSVAQHQPIEVDQPIGVDCTLDKLGALDLRILQILEEAGASQGLSHARRETDALAVILIGSGTSTFLEFDESLERLEARQMVRLDKHGFVSLSERGRDWIHPVGLPVQQADARSARVPAAA